MYIVNLIDIPLLKSIFIYGKTKEVIKESDDAFDESGFGPGIDNEEDVYSLIRYSYDNGFEQKNYYPVPPQDYQYSTFI